MIQNDKVIKRERKSVCFYELSLINCSLHNIGHRNRLLHIVIHKHYENIMKSTVRGCSHFKTINDLFYWSCIYLCWCILQAADGFLFVVQCDSGRLIYVSDSITQVLNQSQVAYHHRTNKFMTFSISDLSISASYKQIHDIQYQWFKHIIIAQTNLWHAVSVI